MENTVIEVTDSDTPDVIKVTNDFAVVEITLGRAGVDQNSVLAADYIAVIHKATQAIVIDQKRFSLRTALRRAIGQGQILKLDVAGIDFDRHAGGSGSREIIIVRVTHNRSMTALSLESDVVLAGDVHDFDIIAVVNIDCCIVVVARQYGVHRSLHGVKIAT